MTDAESKPPTPPTRILFDLGGVVVQLNRTFESACAAAGLDLRPDARPRDPHRTAMRWRLYEAYQTGALPCDDYWPLLALSTNNVYSASEMERIHCAVVASDYPGVADLIDELNAVRGIVTACLSNTNAAHWNPLLGDPSDIIAPSDAIARLQVHGVSHDLRASKPGATIYARMQRRLDAQPHDILFFDDLVENVLAARRRGWNAEVIDHARDTAEQLRGHLVAYGVLN